jgi:hypothetical protein
LIAIRDDSKTMFDDVDLKEDVAMFHRWDTDKRYPGQAGWVYYIDFGSQGVKHVNDYSGAWNKLKVNDITLQITHTVGENCYIFVVAQIFADYIITQKGRFRREFGGTLYD